MSKDKKLRILHVLKSSIYSGAENVVITLIKSLKTKYEMAYLATQGEIEEVLKWEGVPYYLLKRCTSRAIAKIVQVYQPDIIHAHDFSASVMCAMLPGSFRLISHIHYDPPWTKWWSPRSLIYASVQKRIDKVLLVSNEMSEQIIFLKKRMPSLEVVENPIDAPSIIKKAFDNNRSREQEYDLIFVGRLVKQKNPQRFIFLINYLKKRGWSGIRCAIVGDGELFVECDLLIKELGLEGMIDLLGFQENPYFFMKNSKILCMTSRWEGFGLVIAEASILGIPVLSTRTSGSCGILGKQAWELCDDDKMFMEKIETLLKDPVFLKNRKRAAMKYADRFKSAKEYGMAISSIYKEEEKMLNDNCICL